MDISTIRQELGSLPHMTFDQATVMTDLILEHRFTEVLELGFAHGVSTCYMAGALDEIGEGTITTIDLLSARERHPNAEQLLARLGLAKYARVFYEPTCYTWRLMRMLEEGCPPRFDLCYIDGAHNWFTDGFAFFLVDKLLRPGGLIIFDDVDWTYAKSPALGQTDRVKKMPVDQQTTPQVRKIYELLVKPHPSYEAFMVRDGWAYARKRQSSPDGAGDLPRTEMVYTTKYVHVGVGRLASTIWRRAVSTLRARRRT